jgi:hypothetical protein
MNWSDLHDATLVRVEACWSDAVVILVANVWRDGGVREVRLRFSGFTALTVPRECPWGRSSSINEVRVERSTGAFHAEIEMQSGDVLSIRATDFVQEEA